MTSSFLTCICIERLITGSQQGSTLDSLPTPFFFFEWRPRPYLTQIVLAGFVYWIRKKNDIPKTNRQPKHGSLILPPVTPLKVGKQACCLLALVVSHCSGPSCLWHPMGLLVSGYFSENWEGPTQYFWEISSASFFQGSYLKLLWWLSW